MYLDRFFRRLGSCLLLSSTVGLGILHAQAKPTAVGPGSFLSVGYGASAFAQPYGDQRLAGRQFMVELHPSWRFGIEAEARDLNTHGRDQMSSSTIAAGPEVYLLGGRVQPFAKFLVGSSKFHFPYDYGTGTYLSLTYGGGVDLNLNGRLAVRPVDFEMQDWRQFTYGPMHPYGVSMAVLLRLNAVRHYVPR